MNFIQKYDSGLKELGFKLLSWVQKGTLKTLSDSQIEILNSIYYVMSKNEITEIEKLKKEQKEELWEEAKKARSHMNKKDKIKYAKAVYCLTELQKQEVNPVAEAHGKSAESF